MTKRQEQQQQTTTRLSFAYTHAHAGKKATYVKCIGKDDALQEESQVTPTLTREKYDATGRRFVAIARLPGM